MLWSERRVIAAFLLCLLLAGHRPLAAQPAATDLYGDPLPAGASARLGTIRFRCGGFNLRLAFLPDSKTFVTTGEESGIQFWEAETGRLLREISVKPMSIQGFAVSQDGTRIAVAGYWYPEDRSQGPKGECRVLDAATGAVIKTLPRESRDVNNASLAFTPDGKLLVSLGNEGVLRIEEIGTGTEILQQTFPRDSPFLTISPDGKVIAVATGPNTEKLFVWHWQSGQEPQALKTVGAQEADGALAFSPDSRYVAWAGRMFSDDRIHVWEANTARLLCRLEAPKNDDERWHGWIGFTADGKHLVAPAGRSRDREGGSIHVWNTSNWKYDRRLPINAARLAISADSRLVTTGNRAFNFQTGEELAANDAAHRQQINRIVVTPRGEAVTSSMDGTIRVWDLATSKQQLKLTHDYWVSDIAVSADGTQLVSSSLDDTVRLWNLAAGKEIYRLPGHGRLGGRRAVVFAPDGRQFHSFGDDFYLRTWDVRTGKALAEHKLKPTGVKVPSEEDRDSGAFDFFHMDQARFSPDGKQLVIALGKLFVFEVATGKELKVLENDGSHIASIDFSHDSRQLLVSAWGKQLQVPLPDGRTMYTTAKELPVTIWDLSSGTRAKKLLLPGEGAGSAAFSPDGKQFAVVSRRPAVKISFYDLEGNEQFAIDDIPRNVGSLAFTSDGAALIGGLTDTTALVWELASLRKK